MTLAPDSAAPTELGRTYELLDEFFGDDDLTGTEITRSFRQAHPEARAIIVGCTGNAGTASHEDLARDVGQDAVWGKPLPDVAINT